VLRTQLYHAEITEQIIGSAFYVHRKLGPGLLEAAYEECFAHQLRKTGLHVAAQIPVSVNFDDLVIRNAYKIDLLVNDLVVVEVKAVEKLAAVHICQAATYLKFTGLKAGLIINFNSAVLSEGIKRVFNNDHSP
jgi:GxxExxY protein